MDNNNNFDTEDLTGMFDTSEIEQNKVVTVIGYIPPLFFVPLLAAGNSKYAKFHANQACLVTLLSVACSAVSRIISFVIGWIPAIGKFASAIITVVLGIAVAVLVIIGIVNASQGKAKKLPFIGGIAELIK